MFVCLSSHKKNMLENGESPLQFMVLAFIPPPLDGAV